MEYRVEEVASRAGVSVDTVRFYQSRGLLPGPRRVGRVALYDDDHLERLRRIRALQARGFTLGVIARVLCGELDAVDEALIEAVADARDTPTPGISDAQPEEFLTLAELAERGGVPVALLQAVEREGLLIPRRHQGEARYTDADLTALRAGLVLLQHGLPITDVLDLARQHQAATRAIAERAVALFDEHVRQPLRSADDRVAADELVDAFRDLLPATVILVAHHFRRVLLAVAQDHIEKVGDDTERAAVHAEARRRLEATP